MMVLEQVEMIANNEALSNALLGDINISTCGTNMELSGSLLTKTDCLVWKTDVKRHR
jgi:hypothetical protein